MEEALKTSRFLHRLVIGICGAIAAFLLSANDRNGPYERALTEIETLLRVKTGVRDFHKQLHEHLNRRFSEGRLGEELRPAVIQAAAEAHVPEEVVLKAIRNLFPVRYEAPPTNGTLGELTDFLIREKTRQIPHINASCEMLLPEPAEIRRRLADALKKCPGTPVAIRLIAPNFNPELFWLEEESSTADNSRAVPDWHRQESREAHFEIEYMAPRKNIHEKYVSDDFAINGGPMCPMPDKADRTTTFCMSWLKARGFFDGLHTEENGAEIWLPALRTVWNDVKDNSLEGARLFLADKVESRKQTATFLGMTVKEDYAALVSACASILALLYLGLHIAHLRSLTELRSAAVAFPWISLFPGHLSALLTYASLSLLPLGLNAWLLSRDGGFTPSARWLLAILGLASAYALIQTRSLRKLLFTPAAAPSQAPVIPAPMPLQPSTATAIESKPVSPAPAPVLVPVTTSGGSDSDTPPTDPGWSRPTAPR